MYVRFTIPLKEIAYTNTHYEPQVDPAKGVEVKYLYKMPVKDAVADPGIGGKKRWLPSSAAYIAPPPPSEVPGSATEMARYVSRYASANTFSRFTLTPMTVTDSPNIAQTSRGSRGQRTKLNYTASYRAMKTS